MRHASGGGGACPPSARSPAAPSSMFLAASSRFEKSSRNSQYGALPQISANGVSIGRLLIAFILHHDGILAKPLLYLSLSFKRRRSEYYRLLDLVRTDGDWEAWLEFFFEGVAATAAHAVRAAQRLVALFEADQRRMQALRRSAAAALRVLAALRTRPVLNLNEAARIAGIAFPTAAKGMDALLAAGIAREITGQRRNRVFAYDRYLAILSEEDEPAATP